MKRSSSSIPTNIVEGCGKYSEKYFCRILYFSFGSANELEYKIILIPFIDFEKGQKLLYQIEGIKKMLNGLIIKLNNTNC